MAEGSRRTYDWPRPALTVDIAIFTVAGGPPPSIRVLLVQRDLDPFRGRWALPGGFVHENEDLDAAAARELHEETGVRDVSPEQVCAVGTPGRDPRGHVVTVLHVALVPAHRHPVRAAGDARRTAWFDAGALPRLAFDHARLMELAVGHLRRRVGASTACFELLPEAFALGELQTVLEAVLGRPLDRRNFRRKLAEGGFLGEVRGARRTGRHRPAKLYRLLPKKLERHVAGRAGMPF